MTYLEAVNRIFRSTGILRGDDDEITLFTDTQHAAAIALAKIAVEDQLGSLIGDEILQIETTDATIDLVNGTRTYALASDFHKMRQMRFLYVDSSSESENTWVEACNRNADEMELAFQIQDYREQTGDPTSWYWASAANALVGFYPVPTSAQKLRYYYEKEQLVTDETDVLPFHTETQAQQFARLAQRQFELTFESKSDLVSIEQDPGMLTQRGVLMQMLSRNARTASYGR